MKYSIIIPAYNEGENIESFVREFIGRLTRAVREVLLEIIIIENGSRDDTKEACQRLEAEFSGLVTTFSNARGSYGEAIKRGMMESKGTHLSILECDFLDADFVEKSTAIFGAGTSRFIVASKRHPQSSDERSFKRRVLTQAFNTILNVATGYPGSDTHGLKSIETSLAKQLCDQAITTDEIFQTEIVLLAWRQGIAVYELPISIREKRPTPLSIRRRVPMVIDTIRQLRKSLKRFSPVAVSRA